MIEKSAKLYPCLAGKHSGMIFVTLNVFVLQVSLKISSFV